MNKKITDIRELKIGDTIRILGRPGAWSSGLCNKKPHDYDLTYPYTLTIKEIEYRDDHYAMTCGNYGWDLDSIIYRGCELVESADDKIADELIFNII